MSKRKICVVVASRANYGRVKSLMVAIKNNPDLELQLIVGASIMLHRFGRALDIIRQDGFTPDRKLYYIVEGETLTTQAKSTGLGIIELSTAFSDLDPDMVVTVADRFETMATAISASYLNIPLVHIQGGEISGNIDEKVRHAITKLSDIHFPSTERSRERLVKMGEMPEYIFNFGCPGMDTLVTTDLSIDNATMRQYTGVGAKINWKTPYILMVQHPVTTSYGEGAEQVRATLSSLQKLKDYQKVVFWPNIDAGTDDVSKEIRIFRENNQQSNFHFIKNFSPEDYAKVLNNANCVVGNSSSFIREGSFLGVPAVLVGNRQQGRECGENIIISDYSEDSIYQKIQLQLKNGRYAGSNLFGIGESGVQIANTLVNINLNINKRMTY
jgi:UDP-hydrolysing UDP-N-acetyl-D-glucosamine 2-epimerase